MNTSPTTTKTTCPLANETGTEIVSPTGSESRLIALDAAEEANDDTSAVDASPKAKTMKQVLLICGRGLAVLVVIALAGKGFVGRAHNDPPGTNTDDMVRNVDLGIDSSKQVALLDLEGDGNNVAGYDLTKVDGGVSTVRTLEQGQEPITFTKVGDGYCRDGDGEYFDLIYFASIEDVDTCKTKCAACPGQGLGQVAGRELRGIGYDDGGICVCFLDDGDDYASSACTGISGLNMAQAGTGAVCNTDSTVSGECWKVDSNLQCPTPAPAPTKEPTSSPSMSPTQPPSTAPTAPPSIAPTAFPTAPPTESPSKAPTAHPSIAPTASPTAPPSMAPTASPSKAPTAHPSMAPTESPSSAPTAPPTMAPTASPTAPPSRSPTQYPSKAPTAPPTMAPTNKPTTASPTSSPTNSKSAKVAKKVKSSKGKVAKVDQLDAAAANLQVQEMKSGGSSFSISHPLVGIFLALIAFSNLLPYV